MWLSVLVFVYLIVTGQTNGCSLAKKLCQTANGTQGCCISPTECRNSDRLIINVSSVGRDNVKNIICGNDVCCDINDIKTTNIEYKTNPESQQNTTSTAVPTIAPHHVGLSNCETPNGERGNCIPIYNCTVILSLLRNRDIKSNEKRYLREAKCGYDNGVPFVCCGSNVNFSIDGENLNFSVNSLIPVDDCGVQATLFEQDQELISVATRNSQAVLNLTLSNRIFGGNDTDINEFPWVVLLESESTQNHKRLYYCGGTLISSRYVLTAAHCISARHAINIINVRLGEWDYNSKGKNCVLTNKGTVCMKQPVDIEIESLHPHPLYKYDENERYDDIGLIRLKKDVEFSNHIRPICLPRPNDYLSPGEQLTVSGWGLKNFNEMTSKKQKVEVPVISRSQCSVMFEKIIKLSKLGPTQFCAGGEEGKDACAGDSGAPLMRNFQDTTTQQFRWYIEGVVSFGHGCGIENHYGVYTKVRKYLGWIHQTVVP